METNSQSSAQLGATPKLASSQVPEPSVEQPGQSVTGLNAQTPTPTNARHTPARRRLEGGSKGIDRTSEVLALL